MKDIFIFVFIFLCCGQISNVNLGQNKRICLDAEYRVLCILESSLLVVFHGAIFDTISGTTVHSGRAYMCMTIHDQTVASNGAAKPTNH